MGTYELQCAIDVESGVREKTREVSPSRRPLCKKFAPSRFLRVLCRSVLEYYGIKKEFRLCINVVMLLSAIIIHWEKKYFL